MDGEFTESFFRKTTCQFNFAFAANIIENNRIAWVDSSQGFILMVRPKPAEGGFRLPVLQHRRCGLLETSGT